MVVLGTQRWDEVDSERPDVEGVDERNDPLDDCGLVAVVSVAQDAKCDGQAQFNEDKKELHVERSAEKLAVAVANAEALVFDADEDRRHDITADEKAKEYIVQFRMPLGIEDGEENQASRTNDGAKNREDGADLLPQGGVRVKASLMTQVALDDEDEIECHDGRSTHGDEQRLELIRSHI